MMQKEERKKQTKTTLTVFSDRRKPPFLVAFFTGLFDLFGILAHLLAETFHQFSCQLSPLFWTFFNLNVYS